MTMPLDMTANPGARNLQPWVGLGSSLSHSWLDACGPVANPALGDQPEEMPTILRRRQTSRDPLRPQLHGVFEAQVARINTDMAGGLYLAALRGSKSPH